MIDVLVPVLDRPQNVEPLVSSIRRNSKHVSRIVFLCSPGDTAEIVAVQGTGADLILCTWNPGHGDFAMKMNAGFRETTSRFVFLGADDLEFHRGWDVEALQAAQLSHHVVATNDCANPEVKKGTFGTHCLVRRSYVEQEGAALEGPGWLLSETYDHNFVDRELCHVADQRGVYVFAAASEVVHKHPHWNTAPMDGTYRKGLRNFREDRRLFLRRISGLS